MEELIEAEEFELRWAYVIGSTVLYPTSAEVHISSLVQKGYLTLGEDKSPNVHIKGYILTAKGKQYIENIPLTHLIWQILYVKDPFDLKLWGKTWMVLESLILRVSLEDLPALLIYEDVRVREFARKRYEELISGKRVAAR